MCLVFHFATSTFLSYSHPYAQKIHHYTYRFQVPDSETYDVSWTQFTNDKLEKYNWNHLDQYVTTRGEEGFGLIEVRTIS